MSPAARPSSRLTGALLTVGLLLPGLSAPVSARAQDPSAEESPAEDVSREFRDGNALTEWAALRLAEIGSGAGDGGASLQDRLERLRAMYFLGVAEKEWAEKAQDTLRTIRENIAEGTEEAVTVEAYRGALQVVRAKHARMPWNKVKHLNRGAEALDRLVLSEPDNLEVRYLRLASYMFLPFFLQRDDSVASDLAALVQRLPDHPEAFSPPVYRAVVEFVLKNGELEQPEKDRLRGALNTEAPTITSMRETEKSDG